VAAVMASSLFIGPRTRIKAAPVPVEESLKLTLQIAEARVALEIHDQENDISIWDLERRTLSCLSLAVFTDDFVSHRDLLAVL